MQGLWNRCILAHSAPKDGFSGVIENSGEGNGHPTQFLLRDLASAAPSLPLYGLREILDSIALDPNQRLREYTNPQETATDDNLIQKPRKPLNPGKES